MRYFGIDYGKKRVGLSLSDESGRLAMPFKVLSNSENLIEEILDICKKQDVGTIVVGESLDFSQKENDIMQDIKPFAENLKHKSGLHVYMHPEFMTSQEARQIQGENEMHDASAASLILQSYLDTINQKDNNKEI